MKGRDIESDLSLIEISGEDDSLLPQIRNDDGVRSHNHERSSSHSNDSHCGCSPFLNVRSSVFNTESSTAFPSGSLINENVSIENKSETSNFSTEPQQMKRKRKGVGYNLRKSLAWNRAFFTEEGVLNASELSMINSNFSSSNGKKLLGIQEEEPGSSYEYLNCRSDSADFRSQEENLHKELPSNSPNKNREIGLLAKNVSSAKNNVSPDLQSSKRFFLSKILIEVDQSVVVVHDLWLLRLTVKRPATTNTASNTEANFSRIPSCKRDPSLIRGTAKHCNVSGNDPKINHTSRRAIVQKDKMTKSPTISANSVLNKGKTSTSTRFLAPKTSIHDARRNLTSSLPKKNSNSLHRQSFTKASFGTGAMTKSSACHPSDQDGESSKTEVSLPLNTSFTAGNMQESHIQTGKQSGLRMPSPSLQFFSQGKVAPMQSPLERNNKSKKYDVSNVSNASTLGFFNTIEPMLPPVPKKLPKLVNDEASGRNIIPCPSTVHLKEVIVTNSEDCVANNDSQFISGPKPGLQVQNVSEDVTLNFLLDNGLNVAKEVKYIPIGDILSSSLESRQVVEVCYSHTNSEIKHESLQNFPSSYMELDRTIGNQTDNAAAVSDLLVPNVEIRDKNHVDYSLNTAQLGAVLLQDDKESEQCPSQASKATSNLHPGDCIRSSLLDISLKQTVQSCRSNCDNNEKGIDVEKFTSENQHPEANHHLVEKVDFPEGLQRHKGDAPEVNSMDMTLCRRELESHDHRFKDKHKSELSCGDYEVANVIEKSSERVIRFPGDLCPVVLNDSNTLCRDLENQNSQFEDGKFIVGDDHELCLKDGVLAVTTKSSPTVCTDAKVLVSFIEPCVIYESENPNGFTRAPSMLLDSVLNERKIAEQSSVVEVITGSLASATVENFDSVEKIVSSSDELPSYSESSVTVSNNTILNTTIMSNPSKCCSLSNEPELSPDSRLLEQTMLRQNIGHNEQKNPIVLDENVTTSEIVATSPREMLHESTTPACNVPDEDANVHVKKSMESDKQDTLVVKLPSSAAPFSEEWLAALEAAGEEILTKKSGAVQNSPPDKPQPLPGPWSPVRKKQNQAIGPYDCTKYTNISLPPDP